MALCFCWPGDRPRWKFPARLLEFLLALRFEAMHNQFNNVSQPANLAGRFQGQRLYFYPSCAKQSRDRTTLSVSLYPVARKAELPMACRPNPIPRLCCKRTHDARYQRMNVAHLNKKDPVHMLLVRRASDVRSCAPYCFSDQPSVTAPSDPALEKLVLFF